MRVKFFNSRVGAAVLINAVFIAYFCHYHFAVNRFIFSIILSSLVYVLPGWAWFMTLRKKPRDGVAILLYIVSLSFFIYLAGLIFFRVAGIEVTSENLFSYIFIASNASFLIRRREFTGKTLVLSRRCLLIAALFFILVHGYLYWGASTVVPYIMDQDLPAVNPVYGLMKELKPYGLESHFTYIFTKPPLLHFFCGYGIILSDRLEDAKFLYDNAMKTAGTIRMGDRERWDFIKPIRREDEKVFRKEKHELRLYTRLSCLLPAVAIVFIMYHLLMKLTGMKLLAFSGTVLYLSIPEVFVRSSYAGYYALTTFFLIVILYFFLCFSEEERREKGLRFPLFLASVLLALTNHKALLILPALLLLQAVNLRYRFLRSVISSRGKVLFKSIPEWIRSASASRIILGAVAGSLVFWMYACSIDYENFYKDHIEYDFVDHFHREGLYLTSGMGRYLNRYPNVPEVWKEFNRNTGIAFLPLAFVSILCLARRIRQKKAFLFFWFLVGAVGFSLADWKQTKHFMLILLPLLISTVIFIHGRGRAGRLILLAVVAFIIVVNILTIYHMNQDFWCLTVTPEW